MDLVNALQTQLEKQLDTFLRKSPTLGQGVYLARGSVVLGDVAIGDGSSVWYNAVLRGDINRIVIGQHSNIQDNAVVHLADDYPCIIGNWVTVGHSAVVHASGLTMTCPSRASLRMPSLSRLSARRS